MSIVARLSSTMYIHIDASHALKVDVVLPLLDCADQREVMSIVARLSSTMDIHIDANHALQFDE